MFYNSNVLTEGGNCEKCDKKQRELQEGENPKVVMNNWPSGKRGMHVNSRWQDLRR